MKNSIICDTVYVVSQFVSLNSDPDWQNATFKWYEDCIVMFSPLLRHQYYFMIFEKITEVKWLEDYCFAYTHENNLHRFLFRLYSFLFQNVTLISIMCLILQKHLYCGFGSIFWGSLFLHNELWFCISVNHLPIIK